MTTTITDDQPDADKYTEGNTAVALVFIAFVFFVVVTGGLILWNTLGRVL